jgi:hypothetical protein
MATERQKKAASIFLENGGKSVSGAMREAGYTAASASTPKKLTESKGWAELMDKYLPDKKLAETHKKLLSAKRVEHMVFPTSIEDDEIKKLLRSVGCTVRKIQQGEQAKHCWYWAPNTQANLAAVELGYKVKGKLKPDNSPTVNVNLGNMTDAQLRALASGNAGSGKRRAGTSQE